MKTKIPTVSALLHIEVLISKHWHNVHSLSESVIHRARLAESVATAAALCSTCLCCVQVMFGDGHRCCSVELRIAEPGDYCLRVHHDQRHLSTETIIIAIVFHVALVHMDQQCEVNHHHHQPSRLTVICSSLLHTFSY